MRISGKVTVDRTPQTVKVPITLWCRLCDALMTMPDNDIELVARKAERLQQSLAEARRELARLMPQEPR